MNTWIKDSLTTGAVASAATTAAIALLGHAEQDSAPGALNAVSHIVWGEEATRTDALDLRHTVVGTALNAAAVTGWAGVHERMLPPEPSVSRALLTGAATAAIAYFIDYHVVPKRFTPGFEERLSGRAMLGVYTTLALSLAAGSLLRKR
ncbi:MAG: hypothetical protein ACO1NQ_00745 [Flavobacteriales bacterium]